MGKIETTTVETFAVCPVIQDTSGVGWTAAGVAHMLRGSRAVNGVGSAFDVQSALYTLVGGGVFEIRTPSQSAEEITTSRTRET